ncbi:MAG: zinc-dependent alcohol dehydrogenase family protein [Alphaproteobacteria bacterium]
MRAAVMEHVKVPMAVREVPEPTIERHGALIRVEANGVCRSDWHAWVGDWEWIGLKLALPWVLGHEFCGVVEDAGADVRRFKKGDRVVVPFAQGEGTCEQCVEGRTNVCLHGFSPGFSYWGGFGRYVAVPHADVNLVTLPESISFVEGASLGCRFMTSFQGVANRARVRAGEWVAVHGCGGIGLSAVHIATALGANVIAIDIDPRKLDFATKLGAVATVHAGNADPAKAVKEITKGGAHVSVDALGIQATCQNAVRSLRRRGRHLQIGMTSAAEHGEIALPIDKIVEFEITIYGSSGLPAPAYGPMLRMIETGKLQPKKLVGRTIPLEEAGAVLASMSDFATLGVPVVDRY